MPSRWRTIHGKSWQRFADIKKGYTMLMLISNEKITEFGMWIVVPAFIAFLFFIMWDIAKKSHAGRSGTFWIFLVLGAGCIGFIIKMIMEWYFGRTL